MSYFSEGAARVSDAARHLSAAFAPASSVWRTLTGRLDRFNLDNRFASLTSRIIALNLVGLAIVVFGLFFFTRTQAWLIDAKKDSLLIQGDIIAQAIGATLSDEDERSVLERAFAEGGDDAEGEAAKVDGRESLRLSLSPEKVAPVLRKLVKPTGSRARIYVSDGTLLLDSDMLFGDAVGAKPLVPPSEDPIEPALQTFWTEVVAFFNKSKLPLYRDIGRANGTAYPEVVDALAGKRTPLLLLDDNNRHVVSVAVPIQRLEAVHGVLLLSNQGGEIEKIIWRERKSILRIAGLALLAMLICSFLLAHTIARPLYQLSQAAERVQKSLRRREDLPDFTRRTDEVGLLSRTLTDMTNALYKRIESSERFAADVAHELKNPLTSVRSAAETLTYVKSESDRQELIGTIQHDVRRLTRLIDDISKATRVEAEMALNEAQPVDLADLLTTVVGVFSDVHVKDGRRVVLDLAETPLGRDAYVVNGHDLRLGQVFNNLLDNALSFSPPGGTVAIRAKREDAAILVLVEDEGPGIPEGNLERIFERFYTDRPGAESFGKNSGLGLSISKEIVVAHRGRIWAENRFEGTVRRTGTTEMPVISGKVVGARFSVRLPAAHPMTVSRPVLFRARRTK